MLMFLQSETLARRTKERLANSPSSQNKWASVLSYAKNGFLVVTDRSARSVSPLISYLTDLIDFDLIRRQGRSRFIQAKPQIGYLA